jgi:hypothetical protein
MKASAGLQRLGLGVVVEGGTIKRAEWDSLKESTLSTFHKASLELRRGTPYRVYRTE